MGRRPKDVSLAWVSLLPEMYPMEAVVDDPASMPFLSEIQVLAEWPGVTARGEEGGGMSTGGEEG